MFTQALFALSPYRAQLPSIASALHIFEKELAIAFMKIGEGKLFISRNLIKLASPDVGFDGSIPDIQQLLQQLNQSYPSQVSSETKAEIEVAVRGISKDQTLRQKVIGALKAGSMEALRELADNPYVNILLAAWEGCQGS